MSTYPFHGHDNGLVISGPDTGFAERTMTPAELAAREPALKIAKDIYRHANFAGACYVELWRTIADAYDQQLRDLWESREAVRAAYEFLLPYVHIDIRTQALSIYDPEPFDLGLQDQPEGKQT